jgi:hypothetical protein
LALEWCSENRQATNSLIFGGGGGIKAGLEPGLALATWAHKRTDTHKQFFSESNKFVMNKNWR